MKVYTTGEVSRICQVSMSTVNKWFDTGQLEGFRVPGSRHRRIPEEALVEFLQAHGMPCDEIELQRVPKLLIVTRNGPLGELLERELNSTGEFKIRMVGSSFEAGIQAESLQPDCVVVDFAIGAGEARQICEQLRGNKELSKATLIGVVPQEHSSSQDDLGLLDEVFEAPFDPALLAERVRTLIQGQKDLAKQ